MEKSYVHVYTGNGKGKTTASIGLSIRAALAGKKVFIGQFVKGMEYSELKLVDYLSNIEIQQFGRDCFIYNDPTEEDIEAAKKGLEICKKVLESGKYDLVVLDELNIALYYKLFSIEEAIEIIENRDDSVEVIITGRYASKEIIALADLVTEMKEIKHYYTEGVEARKGIEF
ncbi:cob(I)yrinic acid a,c-diamide adenosyltransferase [Anaerosalibacter bizertensis]|uniref:cob(I)yrinic acid a,c-diamide adenosyltransferase n=1 Tax=Anaerosalibacter bizertensis TaxID=932217 RepID=UPI001D030D79|nr:cob(I)yrinic acid a,c-diamide adenosyltransferase [Anaerosalibacter bizertensis]MCB5558404.1 cob(I)yrinic acid a,c-diamide adenosyltransferase [Anaerosalibacter bizertensis]MCG4583904.1 cob(I)yrinic acid a,c-diamide adenosyltransferase [Anaerosalibacter bizertensis]